MVQHVSDSDGAHSEWEDPEIGSVASDCAEDGDYGAPQRPSSAATNAPRTQKPAHRAALKQRSAENAKDGGGKNPVSFGNSVGQRAVEDIYQKKTQLEHILLRPDTYIGSVESVTQPMWVFSSATEAMEFRPITFVPGFYKIFDEILVNAADNKIRDPTMDTIKVTINKDTNTISVYNNGKGIPVEIHKKEGVHVPELIFGHLLTSSNYNDTQRKVTGGRNGYGAKLCNIFSTEFVVETSDSASGKKFRQVFAKNMSKVGEPKITAAAKDDFTKITFKPDLAKFGMERMDDDLEALLTKRVYDLAGCVGGVKVFVNGNRIKIKNFKEYVGLYLKPKAAPEEEGALFNKPAIIHERVNDRWEVCFTPSDGQFNQVSFVNSIATTKGGTHVNHVTDQIVTRLIEEAKKKNKGIIVKPHQVKCHLWVFVNALVENPAFDSQTKETLTLKQSAFGSSCPLSDKFFNHVMKTGIGESVISLVKFKQNQMLKKTDGHKRNRISGITKLDDANMAGTKQAHRCTLILTEGDSAKALAVSGLSVVGRDHFGVFPLRGKLLNVRDASPTQVAQNQEINFIKQILGLQHSKEYDTAGSLRYGHLMIMTDQDFDGSHIKGLIINFLDHFWPSLLKIPGFLVEFITPIVRVSKGKSNNKQELAFYTIPEYETWKRDNEDGAGWTIKYYKGLGTSTSEDAKRYFRAMDQHLKPFGCVSKEDRVLIDMAFNKKKADDRKQWLKQFQPGTYIDHSVMRIAMADFINRELILFSMADNVRSIPSVVDGLKPGQRKIIYSCLKRNLRSEIKLAQLAGYVSEQAAYHHGEQSLQATIVGLAQNFVGSNNINLLEPIGQFGTRLQGGKDAASARYIFTTLSPLTRLLFHPEDNPLLKYLNDDGQDIEPEWYIPIIPMVLVNGSEGIGTGWSSSVPNYNPLDIVENLRRRMDGAEMLPMDPWFKGFQGTIQCVQGRDKFTVSGKITKIDETTLEITELPIRKWTQDYKEFLESMLVSEKQEPFIKDYREYHTDVSVHFVVTLSEKNMRAAEAEGLEKKFKIVGSVALTNMVCFDSQNKIRKYAGPEEILNEFYELRLEYYHRRKKWKLADLAKQLARASNKLRFVTDIVEGTLRVQNRGKTELIDELKKKKYDPFPKGGASASMVNDADDNGNDLEGNVNAGEYDYLLSMPIWNLTREKIDRLKEERDAKKSELDNITALSAVDMWKFDLDKFVSESKKYEEELQSALDTKSSRSTTTSSSSRSKTTAVGKKGGAAMSRKGTRTSKTTAASPSNKNHTGMPASAKPQALSSWLQPSQGSFKPTAAPLPNGEHTGMSASARPQTLGSWLQPSQGTKKRGGAAMSTVHHAADRDGNTESHEQKAVEETWDPKSTMTLPRMFARLAEASEAEKPDAATIKKSATKSEGRKLLGFADEVNEKSTAADQTVDYLVSEIVSSGDLDLPRPAPKVRAKRAKAVTICKAKDVGDVVVFSESDDSGPRRPPARVRPKQSAAIGRATKRKKVSSTVSKATAVDILGEGDAESDDGPMPSVRVDKAGRGHRMGGSDSDFDDEGASLGVSTLDAPSRVSSRTKKTVNYAVDEIESDDEPSE